MPKFEIVTAEEGCVCFLVVFLLCWFFFFPNLPEKLKLLFILGGLKMLISQETICWLSLRTDCR